MSTYICFKCSHQWYKRGDIPPRRCPNHSCRTLKWGRPLEKNSPGASPIVEKKEVFEGLKALIEAVPVRKSVVPEPVKPPIIVDQPDYYSEPTISYE